MTKIYFDADRATNFFIFESTSEAIEFCQTTPDDNRNAATVSEYLHRRKFVGRTFADWDRMYLAASKAWQEGIDKIEAMIERVKQHQLPAPVSRKRRTRFNEDDGAELDYDRLRSGRAYWRTTRRESTRGPQTVTIVADMASPSCYTPDEVLWRAAAALVLTNILEDAGYRVELYAVSHTTNAYENGEHQYTAILLKRAGDPLDLSTIVSTVSGWFYRTAFFKIRCNSDKAINCTMGRPTPLAPYLGEVIPDPENATVIEDLWDERAAVQFVNEYIARMTG